MDVSPAVSLALVVAAGAAVARAPEASADELARAGDEARRGKSLERAILHYERCLKLAPDHLDCTLGLAATAASLAARDGRVEANDKARRHYRRFLELAPADHPHVAKVRAILEQDESQTRARPAASPTRAPAPPPGPDELAREGGWALRGRDFERAISLNEQCLKLEPTHLTCTRGLAAAWASLSARDARSDARDKARALYQRYLELAPPDDAYVPKVRAILAQDGAEASAPSSQQERLSLKKGTSLELELPAEVQRVAVGSEHTVGVSQAGPQRLTVTARQRGRTTVLAWLAGGERRAWIVEVR